MQPGWCGPLLDHCCSAGRASAPRQTGVTLDLGDSDVLGSVVCWELYGRLRAQ